MAITVSQKDAKFTRATLNIEVTRGDAWSMPVTFDFDLTGYTFLCQIRASASSATPVAITVANTNLAGGIVTIGQTAAEAPGEWDLQLTSPGGLPRTYIGGKFVLGVQISHV